MLIGLLLIALAGLAIGATAIGGVLVVPALHRWMGLDMADAMALSSQAFFWTGAWALWGLPGRGLALIRTHALLLSVALLGSVLGVWLSGQVPAPWLRSWVGALALISGGYGLWRVSGQGGAGGNAQAWPNAAVQAVLGLLVGIGSALSGTGGPVMLLPLLMLLRCDFARSVQVALVIQVPIAAAATATHAAADRLDLAWGLALALVLMAAAETGRRLSRRLSQRALQSATAVLLVGTGVWMLSI